MRPSWPSRWRIRRSLGRGDPGAPAARLSPRAVPAGEGRRAAGGLAAGKGLVPRALIRAPLGEAPCPPGRGQPQHPPAPRPARRQGWGGAARRAGAGRGAGPGRAARRRPLGLLGPAALRGAHHYPEGLRGGRRRQRAGHEDPVAGAVRAGAAVAGDPGRLRRDGALLPGTGRRLLRAWLEVGQGLWDVLLRPSLPPHGRLLLRLRQGMPSSPVHRGGVEPLERLRRPVQASGPSAEAPGAAGAPERRRALPAPGGEGRLPGLFDAPGPGLRALLRPCLYNYLCVQQGENKTSRVSTVVYRHRGHWILYGVQDGVADSSLRSGKPPPDSMDAVSPRGVHGVRRLSAPSHELCEPSLFWRWPGLRWKSDSPLASHRQSSMSGNLEKSSASGSVFLSSCSQFYFYIDCDVNTSECVCKHAKPYRVMFSAS